MVKVKDVIVQPVGCINEVAQKPSVLRDRFGNPQGLIQGERGRSGVGQGTYPTDARCDPLGIQGMAPDQNRLDAAEKSPRRTGMHDLPVLHSDLHLKVPLDAGYGIDGDGPHFPLLSSVALRKRGLGKSGNSGSVQPMQGCPALMHQFTPLFQAWYGQLASV